MKKQILAICLVSIAGFSAESKSPTQTLVAGVAVHSFEQSHYIIQADQYFFRIEKSKLAPELRAEFDRAVEEIRPRGFAIPQEAISYTWPVAPNNSEYLPLDEKRDHFIRHGANIEIAGTVSMSFEESHYVVLIDHDLYRISKASLSDAENAKLANVNPGERVNLSVTERTLQRAGRFSSTGGSRGIASKSIPEGASIEGGRLEISGTVLHSFSDPLVIVRANQTFFQLNRSKIGGPRNPKLNSPGTFVRFHAPLRAVDFIWTVPSLQESPVIRTPASNKYN